jgi:hypothetical protein
MRAHFVALVVSLTALSRSAFAQSPDARSPAPPAAIAPPATVLIQPPTCAASTLIDVDAFMGILTAELREDGVERVDASQGSSALAIIKLSIEPCADNTPDALVTIEDLVTAKRVSRRILLQDVPVQARPRTLALAVAELLRASWLELTLPSVPPAPVPPAVRDAVLRHVAAAVTTTAGEIQPERSPEVALEASLGISWRAFFSGHASLYGGRAALAFPFYSRSLRLRFDASWVYGSAQDVLGDVHLGLASAGAGLLYATPLARPVTFEIGPRIEAGVAWASATPSNQQTSSYAGVGYTGTLSVLGEVSLRLSPSWRLAVDCDAGGVFAPFAATSDGRQVTGVQGATVGLTVGLVSLR